MNIPFTDGSQISLLKWADMVAQEGKLGVGRLCNPNGLRCALGVLLNTHYDNSDAGYLVSTRTVVWSEEIPELYELIIANDVFVGTPTERAQYMVAKLCEMARNES